MELIVFGGFIVTFLVILVHGIIVDVRPKDVYLVTAHRWGNSESHNYIVGVFKSLKRAEREAEECEEDRGGKYECRICHIEVDKGGGHRKIIKKIWDDYPENYFKRFEKEK